MSTPAPPALWNEVVVNMPLGWNACPMECIFRFYSIGVKPIPLGAFLTNHIELSGKRIGVILSGGNVDFANLPWID